MANEVSTHGISVKYCVETTAGTRPTTGYTVIPNITDIPSLNGAPNNLECTDLSDTEYKRYIGGLKDPGGNIGFTVNLTNAFETAWNTLMTAANSAKTDGKAVWWVIQVQGLSKNFFFAGYPSKLGFDGASVDAVLQTTAYVEVNQIEGFATALSD